MGAATQCSTRHFQGFSVNTVEIYALCDPSDGSVRYIGKANESRKRLATHLRDSRRRVSPVNSWLRKLQNDRQIPILRVIATVPEAKWREEEIRWIAFYRSQCRLLNLADGGDQPSQTHEQRANAARAATVARIKNGNTRHGRMGILKQRLGVALLISKKIGGADYAMMSLRLRLIANEFPHIFPRWLNAGMDWPEIIAILGKEKIYGWMLMQNLKRAPKLLTYKPAA